jgi:Virulence factor BrkB
MNPIERAIRRVDAAQQRHKASAFVVGVIKKYGDDNGGVLAASLAHSGFVSLFPLLLVLVTILGLVASGDPALRREALNAVTSQVPLIGHQLAGNVHQLRRSSVIGLVAGLLALTWGTTGLAQAGLFTMAQVWNLPGPARPGYLQRLGRAALFLAALGLGVIVTTLLTSLGAYSHNAAAIVVLLEALAAAANIGMYFIGFRVLTPRASRPASWWPARSPAASPGRWCRPLAPISCIISCAAPRCTACSPRCSDSWPGSTWASKSPCTPPRPTWCWRGGYGRAPSSSRRSPRPTGPSWRLRHCKTSGATTSMSTCRMTTSQPAPRHRVRPRGPPMRSRRPHSPGRATALTNRPGTCYDHA